MSKKTVFTLFAVILCLSWGVAISETIFAADTDITPEKVVAGHLKSLGTPEKVAEIRSRVLNGLSTAQFVQGAGGIVRGEFLMASDTRRLGIVMKYDNVNYPKEYFAFDGDKVTVGYISPGQRSPLADFIFRYNGPMKEGLFGGALSVGWPLLDTQKKQATMKSRETTIEGKKLYELEYLPKKGFGDVKVKLYFDIESFRHVRTEYTVRIKNDASALPSVVSGATPEDRTQNQNVISPRARTATAMDNQPDSIYKLVERFDDFQTVGGVTLPFSYYIDYSVEGSGNSFIGHWSNKAAGKFINNGEIDGGFFQAQK
jgi:hypothetical protein